MSNTINNVQVKLQHLQKELEKDNKNEGTIELTKNEISFLLKLVNNKLKKPTPKRKNERMTHFLSLKIKNPSLIRLSTKIQENFLERYSKEKNINISTAIIRPETFHISLNVLSLNNKEQIDTFLAILDNVQFWLNNIHHKTSTSTCENKMDVEIEHSDESQNKIFKKVLIKKDFDKRLSNIYQMIHKLDIHKKLTINCFGLNDFKKNIIFMDFKHKCKRLVDTDNESVQLLDHLIHKFDDDDEAMKSFEPNMKLLELIFELITHLCNENKIACARQDFKPHCTLLKTSKMRMKELKKLNKKKKKGFDEQILNSIMNKFAFDEAKKDVNCQDIQTTMESIDMIQLCEMGNRPAKQYYNVLKVVKIPRTL